jgi:iron-sulfur cluster assembly protein
MKVSMHDPNQLDGFKDIRFTHAAERHIEKYISDNKAEGIRFSISQTGCSGYMYHVNLITEVNADDILISMPHNIQLYIDKKSFPFIQGTEIDYEKTFLKSQFIFNNPNADGLCGCGESFTLKDENNETE